MTSAETDENLVKMAQNGDREAFGEIVRRWERKIYALCFGMLGREDEARDATQETFINAFRYLPDFRGDSKVSSWLHRIAVNNSISRTRRTKVRAEIAITDDEGKEIDELVASSAFSPLRGFESRQKMLLVRRAVLSLPQELRQIVVMKEFEEMTFQEIADALEMPLSTVKSRLYTALKQLRMKLEKTSVEIV